MRKVLLLRVGIDKGCGGSLSPIFPDRSFEYIPIPESQPTTDPRTYTTILGRAGVPLARYVKPALAEQHPHFDPEFETCTYGDPTPLKRRQLLQLVPGDLLVFYAGLQPQPPVDPARLYIIGLIEVESVHDLWAPSASDLDTLRSKIGNNAHFFRVTPDKGLVIVRGNKARSELFTKAVPLGDGADNILCDLSELVRYSGSLRRAVGHWIDEQNPVHALEDWLKLGPMNLVGDKARLFSYVVAHDYGFAPNPDSGYCTLACCKPRIRKSAKKGDWIVGLSPARFGPPKLCYVMRVSEKVTFDQYYHVKRFQGRRDNIYHRLPNGRYEQLLNDYHNLENYKRDTQTDWVLMGSLFWYFGQQMIEPPKHLLGSDIFKRCRDRRKITDPEAIKGFVTWLANAYRVGVHSTPRDKSSQSRQSRKESERSPLEC